MPDWNKIKKEIKDCIGETLAEKKGQPIFQGDEDLDETIDLLKDVISYPVDRKLQLEGVEQDMLVAFEKILVEKKNFAEYPKFLIVEAFIKKLLLIVNKRTYEEENYGNEKLHSSMSIINVKSENFKLYDKDSNKKPIKKEPDDFLKDEYLLDHLIRVYNVRNNDAHLAPILRYKKLAEAVESFLIVYLYAVKQNFTGLRSSLERSNEPDFTEYLGKIVEGFNGLFEKFRKANEENIHLPHETVRETLLRTERVGSVEELRPNVEGRRMLILGDAGMGKTTTLQYLQYIDAKAKLADSGRELPVLINLGSLEADKSIKSAIFEEVGKDNFDVEKILEKGKINLFLDAFNEIPTIELQENRQREIQSLVNDYKKTFIIITNRANTQHNPVPGVPVFNLELLDIPRIKNFLNAYSDTYKESVKLVVENIDKQNNHVDKQNNLIRIVNTPFKLTHLMEVVHNTGKIPDNKNTTVIIDQVINSLFEREKAKGVLKFDSQAIQWQLAYLATKFFENNLEDSWMEGYQILKYFKECLDRVGAKTDTHTDYALNISTELGILVRNGTRYSFAHKEYLDHYHVKGKNL